MGQNSLCVICDAELALDNQTVKDELIECRECGTELVVVAVGPFVIEEAPQTEEDWGE